MQSRRGPDYPNQDWELAVREGFREEAMFHCRLREISRGSKQREGWHVRHWEQCPPRLGAELEKGEAEAT